MLQKDVPRKNVTHAKTAPPESVVQRVLSTLLSLISTFLQCAEEATRANCPFQSQAHNSC